MWLYTIISLGWAAHGIGLPLDQRFSDLKPQSPFILCSPFSPSLKDSSHAYGIINSQMNLLPFSKNSVSVVHRLRRVSTKAKRSDVLLAYTASSCSISGMLLKCYRLSFQGLVQLSNAEKLKLKSTLFPSVNFSSIKSTDYLL